MQITQKKEHEFLIYSEWFLPCENNTKVLCIDTLFKFKLSKRIYSEYSSFLCFCYYCYYYCCWFLKGRKKNEREKCSVTLWNIVTRQYKEQIVDNFISLLVCFCAINQLIYIPIIWIKKRWNISNNKINTVDCLFWEITLKRNR